MKTKCRYDVITDTGKQEYWTGVFNSVADAKRWYNKHGKKQEEKNGYKMILIKFKRK